MGMICMNPPGPTEKTKGGACCSAIRSISARCRVKRSAICCPFMFPEVGVNTFACAMETHPRAPTGPTDVLVLGEYHPSTSALTSGIQAESGVVCAECSS